MSGYIVFLLVTVGFIGFLLFESTLDDDGVATAKTIVVDPGGGMDYTSIQAAIDYALPGDSIRVYSGTYKENLNIDKKIKLYGDDMESTIIDGGGTGDVIFISANNVSITKFTIINSGSGSSNTGIMLNEVQNCTISNNNVSLNNNDGIWFYKSSEIKLHNNIVSFNDGQGIYLYKSSLNSIEGNTVLSNYEAGIVVDQSNDNIIQNNKASGTIGYSSWFRDYGDGIEISSSSRCIIKDNEILSNNDNGIILDHSSQNTVSNNIVSKNGLDLFWTSGSGIYITHSNSNTLENNTITQNSVDGIYISSSSNNKLMNNTIKDNVPGFFYGSGGIIIFDSNSNILENNTVGTNDYGIYLASSNTNLVINNTCSNSEIYGITLADSINNTLTNNTMIGDSIKIFGDELEQWDSHNINTTNTVNNKPVIYWIDRVNGTIPPNVGEVILVNCSGVLTENQHLNDCSIGILMGFSSKNSIKNNTVSNAMYGISIRESNNNSFINNIVLNSRDDGFYIHNSSNNTFIDNNASLNDRHGMIFNENSNNNTLRDNIASSNDNGIYVVDSCYNILENNFASKNDQGIRIWYSHDNTITKNRCSNNVAGFHLNEASRIRFTNNVMINNGIYIEGGGIDHWNSHDIDTSNIVNGKSVRYWKDKTGGTVNANAGQVILANCSEVIVENQAVNNCSEGISLGFSINNTLRNNIFSWNKENGIRLYHSNNNTINSNTASSNNMDGIYLESSNGNIFDINIISTNKRDGVNLYYSNSNIMIGNTVSSNRFGIYIYNSNDNTINNNIASENHLSGAYIYYSNTNILKNNIASTNNQHGYYIDRSNNNILRDSSALSNGLDGVYLSSSINNTITNNSFSSNRNGISVSSCSISTVDENIIENNKNGIDLISSHHNIFIENSVKQNSDVGFIIDSNSHNNSIYHNNFISNTIQAIDNGSNIWNNSKHEGNYWSDYKGLDNAKNGRIANDGIGDTKIPHLGVDNFPIMTPTGWKFIYTPILTTQNYIVTDGKYLLSWNTTSRITKYVLEEDNTTSFISPVVIYSGVKEFYQFENISDGIYYYRVKAFRESYVSDWSNIVNITVDYPPTAPTGLVVLNTTSDEITLSWNPNPEPDIEGYHIFINNSHVGFNASFHHVQSVPSSITQCTISNLTELTTYHFFVVAFDKVPTNSSYSNIVSTTTIMRDYPPEINNSIDDFTIVEDTVDDSTINLYHWFSDINNDQLTFRCEGQSNINVTIFQENGTVILKPITNWNGEETIKFYAADKFGEAFDSVTITITPVNDPPEGAEIIRPQDGIITYESMTLDFIGICNDPDLPYGDTLTFKWLSNISGEFGENESLENVALSAGEHLITFRVSDSVGKTSSDTIAISILPIIKPDIDDEGLSSNEVAIIFLIVILVIIFVLLLFMFFRKEKPPKTDEIVEEEEEEIAKDEEELEPTVTEQPTEVGPDSYGSYEDQYQALYDTPPPPPQVQWPPPATGTFPLGTRPEPEYYYQPDGHSESVTPTVGTPALETEPQTTTELPLAEHVQLEPEFQPQQQPVTVTPQPTMVAPQPTLVPQVQPEPQSPQQSPTITCPVCQMEVQKYTGQCPRCGCELE